ncbi:MAG: hypothetical protein QNI95_18550 [Desulfobacterales bacterium]|nr:hypothetical protein [Desulfobacterales bacterium]
MNTQSNHLEMAIYRRHPNEKRNVKELNVGLLLNELTEDPYQLAGVHESGSLQLRVKRTQPWEIICGLFLIGSTLFLRGAANTMSKQVGQWLASRTKDLHGDAAVNCPHPQVRLPGKSIVTVDPDAPEKSRQAIALLIMEAARNSLRLQLIVESLN